LLSLAQAQMTLGDDVHVILLNDGLLAARMRAEGVPNCILPESTSGPLKLLARLHEHCVRLRPDVVHTHRMKENVLGAMAARLSGVPGCVRTAHGDTEHELRWFQGRKQIARIVERLFVFGLHDATVAVSRELADKLTHRWLPGRIEVVANGIDPDQVRHAARNDALGDPLRADEIRIALVGRLVPVKRTDVFLEACTLLTKLVDAKVHAYVIGDGPLRTELEKQAAAQPNLACTFTGFVDNPAAWIKQMDLMAITSDHEGLPMSLLEAFALSVPVVSRAVGGIPDFLEDARRGRLVHSDRPSEVAQAMAAELLHPLAGRKDASADVFPEQLTAKSMARSYRQFYLRALSAHGAFPGERTS